MIFIAAEMGVNFRDIRDAKRMIGIAKSAGADGVKFQVFKEEHVIGHHREEELKSKMLSKNDLYEMKGTADGAGIEFFATPMFLEAVDWLEAVGVKRYKIRYADRFNIELINAVLKTNKKVFLSCDEAWFNPPLDFYRLLHEGWDDLTNIEHIYCIPEYPPPLEKIHFPIYFPNSSYSGYSNHYPSIVPPLVAAARGCGYLEVHLKQDKYSGGYKPIDDAVSITFSQLSELCRLVRGIEKVT